MKNKMFVIEVEGNGYFINQDGLDYGVWKFTDDIQKAKRYKREIDVDEMCKWGMKESGYSSCKFNKITIELVETIKIINWM